MSSIKDAYWLKPYHFKKGEGGNKNGARNYNNRRRAARDVSPECLSRISSALFDGSMEDLKGLLEASDVTPIEKLCIGVVIRAYDKGDAQALGMLLDRFVGKVIEKKEISVPQASSGGFANLTDDELAKRAAQLEEAGL